MEDVGIGEVPRGIRPGGVPFDSGASKYVSPFESSDANLSGTVNVKVKGVNGLNDALLNPKGWGEVLMPHPPPPAPPKSGPRLASMGVSVEGTGRHVWWPPGRGALFFCRLTEEESAQVDSIFRNARDKQEVEIVNNVPKLNEEQYLRLRNELGLNAISVDYASSGSTPYRFRYRPSLSILGRIDSRFDRWYGDPVKVAKLAVLMRRMRIFAYEVRRMFFQSASREHFEKKLSYRFLERDVGSSVSFMQAEDDALAVGHDELTHQLTHQPGDSKNCLICRMVKARRGKIMKGSATRRMGDAEFIVFDAQTDLEPAFNGDKHLFVLKLYPTKEREEKGAKPFFYCAGMKNRSEAEWERHILDARFYFSLDGKQVVAHSDNELAVKSLNLQLKLMRLGQNSRFGIAYSHNTNSMGERAVREANEGMVGQVARVPLAYWNDCAVNWSHNVSVARGLTERVNSVKCRPSGWLGFCHLSREVYPRPSKVRDRGTPVAFLCPDRRQAGGVYVLFWDVERQLLRRTNVADRDVIWHEGNGSQWAFTKTLDNLKQIKVPSDSFGGRGEGALGPLDESRVQSRIWIVCKLCNKNRLVNEEHRTGSTCDEIGRSCAEAEDENDENEWDVKKLHGVFRDRRGREMFVVEWSVGGVTFEPLKNLVGVDASVIADARSRVVDKDSFSGYVGECYDAGLQVPCICASGHCCGLTGQPCQNLVSCGVDFCQICRRVGMCDSEETANIINDWCGMSVSAAFVDEYPIEANVLLDQVEESAREADMALGSSVELSGDAWELGEYELDCAYGSEVVPPGVALNHPDKDVRQGWIDAIREEVDGLTKREEVLKVVPRSEAKPEDEIIPSKIVLELKPDGRQKCRIVACGNFQQKKGSVAYASTVAGDLWVCILVIAWVMEMAIAGVDVATAFCQTSAEFVQQRAQRVFCRIPKYADGTKGSPPSDLLWLILKSLYGLTTAAADWQATLNAFMMRDGWTRSMYDHSVYYRVDKLGRIIVYVHVDDVNILATKLDQIFEFAKRLGAAFTLRPLKVLSEDEGLEFLSHKIRIGSSADGRVLTISQSDYVESFTESVKPGKLKHQLFRDDRLDEGEILDEEGKKWIQTVTGSVGYACYRTRLDVATCCAKIQERQSNPTEGVRRAAQNMLEYCALSSKRGLKWTTGGYEKKSDIKCFKLIGYVDSDFAPRRSRMGCVVHVVINGKSFFVHGRTARQSVITLSTPETELMGVGWCTRICQGLAHAISEIFGLVCEGIEVVNDNEPAVMIANGQGDLRKVRHLTINKLYVAEKVREGSVIVRHEPGQSLVADLLTKVCPASRIEELMEGMGIVDLEK